MKATMLYLAALLTVTFLAGAQETKQLKMTEVMTSQELSDSGVSGLTTSQRDALNAWLNRYTKIVIRIASNQRSGEQPATSGKLGTKGDCIPAVESTIEGDFEGWEGETIFKLDNGQIWQQLGYEYTYSYSFRPDVTIYQSSAGCTLKVEDEDDTITVHRIK